MAAVPCPTDYEILSPVKRSTATHAFRMVGGEEDWYAGEQTKHGGHGRRTSRSRPRILLMLFLGAIAILAWESYSHAAREFIAGLSPQLRWLAPQAENADTASDRIEQITQNMDRIASDLAASREQITRSIDHLAAGQDQMTLEIIRLRAVSQFGASKKEDPPPQPASGPTRKASQRSLH
jgi:hypothetical protein